MSKMSVDAFQMIADWLPRITEVLLQSHRLDTNAPSKDDSCILNVLCRSDKDVAPLLATVRHPNNAGLPNVAGLG